MDNLRYSAEWARWRWVAAAWPTSWIITRAGRVTAVSLRTSQHPAAVNDNRRQA